jgi:malonate transporter
MLLTILNNVLPVFVLILLGQLLLRYQLAGESFFKTSDRLVYFVFFPAMLFWKIGSVDPNGPQARGIFAWDAMLGVLITVTVVWLLTLLYARLTGMSRFQAGSFSQSSYRCNTYIGMAVLLTGLGEAGAASFGIMLGISVPFINTLAVSTLVWYGEGGYPAKAKVKLLLKSLLANPLILGCLAGVLYSRLHLTLPVFLDNTLQLTSAITLPMALLSIGSALTLDKVRGCFKPALAASLFKLLACPLIGWLVLSALGAKGLPFEVAMIFFALPTATAAYILAVQFKSDADLVMATTVLSTLLSFISLSAVLVAFGH